MLTIYLGNKDQFCTFEFRNPKVDIEKDEHCEKLREEKHLKFKTKTCKNLLTAFACKLATCMGSNATFLHDVLQTRYLLVLLESVLGAQR